MEIQCITCSQWLELVRTVKEKGIKCDGMESLCLSCPQINMVEYQELLYNELAKLETVILRETIERFEISVNRCLTENDLEYLNHGIRDLKKDLSVCFFFHKIEQYPIIIRKGLTVQMTENLSGFLKEFDRYVKRIEESGSDIFFSDFGYICRKANLKKYIEELNIYV